MENIGVLILIGFLILIFAIFWNLFKKCGESGWKIFIPFYNVYIMGKIAAGETFGWIYLITMYVISWIPIVGLIIALGVGIYWAVELGNRFNKGTGFKIALCIPIISLFAFYNLAFDDRAIYKAKKPKLRNF